MALDMQCRKVQRFNRPLKHCQVASAVSIPKYCELCVMGDYHTPGGGTMEIILPEGRTQYSARGVHYPSQCITRAE